jgi:two-component system, LytTR family, response regulator
MASIFIIDDDIPTTKAIGYYLQKDGHQVEICNSSQEALRKLLSQNFDLIISDIGMPNLNGFELRAFLLQNNLGRTPFIFLSGDDDKHTKLKAWDLSIDSYITKPIDPDELKAIVRGILSRKAKDIPIKKKELFIKNGGEFLKIKFDAVFYIQSFGDYIFIKTFKEKIKILYTLKQILTEIPEDQFQRVHKSYIIRLDKIQTVKKDSVKILEELIPIGEKYRSELLTNLGLDSK